MVISEAAAKTILEPYKARLRECIMQAWEDYESQYGHVRYIHTPRTRANIVHDHMVHHARRLFEGNAGVFMSEIKGLFLIEIEGQLLVRFKKLDEDKKHHNYPTPQNLEFWDQLDLPGIPHLTRLVAGYELNNLQTAIDAIYITCPNGSCNAWYFELEDEMARTEIVELPASIAASERVSVKDTEKRENYGQID